MKYSMREQISGSYLQELCRCSSLALLFPPRAGHVSLFTGHHWNTVTSERKVLGPFEWSGGEHCVRDNIQMCGQGLGDCAEICDHHNGSCSLL